MQGGRDPQWPGGCGATPNPGDSWPTEPAGIVPGWADTAPPDHPRAPPEVRTRCWGSDGGGAHGPGSLPGAPVRSFQEKSDTRLARSELLFTTGASRGERTRVLRPSCRPGGSLDESGGEGVARARPSPWRQASPPENRCAPSPVPASCQAPSRLQGTPPLAQEHSGGRERPEPGGAPSASRPRARGLGELGLGSSSNTRGTCGEDEIR